MVPLCDLRLACCGMLVLLLGCSRGLPARNSEQAPLPSTTGFADPNEATATPSADPAAALPLGTVPPTGWETKLPEPLRPAQIQGLMLFRADVTEAILAWYRLEGRWPDSIRSISEHHLLPFVPVAEGGHVLALLDRDEPATAQAYARFTFTPDSVEYLAFLGSTQLDHGRVTKAEILERLSGMQSAMPAEGPSHASIGQQLIAGEEPEAAFCLHWASLWLRRIEAYIALEGRFPEIVSDIDRALGQSGAGSPSANWCEEIAQAAYPGSYFSLSLDPTNGRWEAGFQLPDRPFRGWRYSYSINAQSGTFPARPEITDASNRADISTCVLAWPCAPRKLSHSTDPASQAADIASREESTS